MTEPFQPFLQRCVSVDLEVDPATATIFAFAAVRDDARPPILAKKRDLMAALDRLEAESAEAEHASSGCGAAKASEYFSIAD